MVKRNFNKKCGLFFFDVSTNGSTSYTLINLIISQYDMNVSLVCSKNEHEWLCYMKTKAPQFTFENDKQKTKACRFTTSTPTECSFHEHDQLYVQ